MTGTIIFMVLIGLIAATALGLTIYNTVRLDARVPLTPEENEIANTVLDNRETVEKEIEKIADPVKQEELRQTLDKLEEGRIDLIGGTTAEASAIASNGNGTASASVYPDQGNVDIRQGLGSNLGIGGPSAIPRKDHKNLSELWGYLQENDVWLDRRGSQDNFFV